MHAGTSQVTQLPRHRGEVETPTSCQTATRRPRPQAVRACGALPLPFRLSARPSPCAPWARGLLSAFWERGSPDLPACGLRRGSNGGPARPIFINARLKTLARGQASRGRRHGASSSMASSGWLARRRRDQGGVPHEVPMTQAMMTKGARRAPARAASPFPLWCKGSKRRREDQAKAPISVQRDRDQSNGGKEVTMEPRTASPQGLWQAKTNFSQDKFTRCSPSNWPIVGALPAQIFGERPRALDYK